jgi:hypothetical protein
MNESEKRFSFTRAALSTGGRAKSNVLSIQLNSYQRVLRKLQGEPAFYWGSLKFREMAVGGGFQNFTPNPTPVAVGAAP